MSGELHRRLHSWKSNFLKVPFTFLSLSPPLSLSLSLSVVQEFPSPPSTCVFFHLRKKTRIPTHTKQQFLFCKFLGRKTRESKLERKQSNINQVFLVVVGPEMDPPNQIFGIPVVPLEQPIMFCIRLQISDFYRKGIYR